MRQKDVYKCDTILHIIQANTKAPLVMNEVIQLSTCVLVSVQAIQAKSTTQRRALLSKILGPKDPMKL